MYGTVFTCEEARGFELVKSSTNEHSLLQLTPYTGMEVSGKVEHTFVRGQLVFSKGDFPATLCGQPILQFPKHEEFKAAASA